MRVKLVIAGCRDYADYEEASAVISVCLCKWGEEAKDLVVLSGGCRGADALGERFAREHGVPIERYLPNWARYGRGAGCERNRQMAAACDGALCFWDGKSRGTASLIRCVTALQKPLCVYCPAEYGESAEKGCFLAESVYNK